MTKQSNWWDNWPPKEELAPELKPLAEHLSKGLKAMCNLPKVNFKLRKDSADDNETQT